MPNELKATPPHKPDIDQQCRWRDPQTEVRCIQNAVKRSDGTQTGYCEKHAGYSGMPASSFLSPRTVGRWKKLKG